MRNKIIEENNNTKNNKYGNKEKENNIEKEIICVGCPKGCRITIEAENDEVKNISGYSCEEGKSYAREEFKNPTRILPTAVRVSGGKFPLVSVKTEKPIPRNKLLPAMKVIAEVMVEAPVEIGDNIIEDILNTGVNVIATRRVKEEEK